MSRERGQGAGGASGGLTDREVRTALRHVLGRRRTLWLYFAAALLPLAALLALQYLWLQELQKSAAVARRASLSKLLEIITKEATGPYFKAADRALGVSAAMLHPRSRELLARHFSSFSSGLARHHFVVTFGHEKELLLYDSAGTITSEPTATGEALAIWVAVAPWSLTAAKGEREEKAQLFVEERDPRNRIVLRSVTDSSRRVVGVVGMVLDEEKFRQEILPKAIQLVLTTYPWKNGLEVSVCDAKGQSVLPDSFACTKHKALVKRNFWFVFTDWTLAIDDRRESPEAWAQRNFTFNLVVSLALAGVLLLTVAVALRTAAREVRLSAMKSDFVSNVSHELRTPLASIRVFGELMRLGRVSGPEKVREYGEHIENESRRLSQLVENILDFSRIESGRKVYDFTAADLAEVVRGAVASFAVRMQQAGFTVKLDLPDQPLGSAHIDASAIDHALCNLLDNAVKYSQDNREVVVRLERVDGAAEIAVTDHGIGISRTDQKRIFERFYRVGTGAVHEVRGVGLGLAIVQHIVAAHGGSVRVESEPGRGSTFTIRLPLATSTSTTDEQPS